MQALLKNLKKTTQAHFIFYEMWTSIIGIKYSNKIGKQRFVLQTVKKI